MQPRPLTDRRQDKRGKKEDNKKGPRPNAAVPPNNFRSPIVLQDWEKVNCFDLKVAKERF